MWKSTDGGTTFRPIFDKQTAQSIGALALDPSHPDTYWAGTGESWMRNSVSVGDGIYKTTDGGETWTNMGLPNSEHIAKIVVDPTNGDVVYACVPGRLWSDSADRGLYKTTDGGKTWAQIIKAPNLSTGCSTVAMDPKNPRQLFAGLWDFRRTGWGFRSGGSGPDQPSAGDLMVSEDGGASWASLKSNAALPKGPWGRQAVAFAPSDPNIVYAFIEATRSALWRSEDGGKTWAERDRSQNMVWRPFYFANLIVDPANPNHVFKTDLSLIASDDGGKSFSTVADSTHSDHHAVWIDPTNSKHVVTGNDGGLYISYDGANRWQKADNLPISQFYHVSVDDKDPYQVYGGLQDNSAWAGDSAYPGGITSGRWENLGGGDGFWAWADPAAPTDFAYTESQGGSLAAGQPQDAGGARHPAEVGLRGEAALQLEHAGGGQPDRGRHDLHRRAVSVPQPRPRPELGQDLAGPDHQRSGEAEAGGERRHHRRQLRRRDPHHDLRHQRVAQGRRDDLGRDRRRQCPAHPRRRQELGQSDQEHRHAGLLLGVVDRGQSLRPGRGLRGVRPAHRR